MGWTHPEKSEKKADVFYERCLTETQNYVLFSICFFSLRVASRKEKLLYKQKKQTVNIEIMA